MSSHYTTQLIFSHLLVLGSSRVVIEPAKIIGLPRFETGELIKAIILSTPDYLVHSLKIKRNLISFKIRVYR